ncbi:MAG: type II toxin-antitoxin system RelE/ParE family toxin [Planctomycetes bacterium]|nr:type II toxin-antitoxin system RelE/ParE family toxin [Planctomycetota bacterium]
MSYSIQFTSSAAKSLTKLPASAAQRISAVIDTLGAKPRPQGCKKLSGQDNLYRVRAGDYRIVYQIQDKQLVVLIVRIGHRRDIYRDMD